MLTRLQVDGFKNLMQVDIRFGAFTCIAGGNGVGKSNLFDAIAFLGRLADRTLMDAAEGDRSGDVQPLFHRVGADVAAEMSLVAEMVVPAEGVDELGQPVRAARTSLVYSVTLRQVGGFLELVREDLRSADGGLVLISSASDPRIVTMHPEVAGARPTELMGALPRTALSAASSTWSGTAALARAEMRSWRVLSMEPSALREPDKLNAPSTLAPTGAHLPAMLYGLARKDEAATYARVSNGLALVTEGIRDVFVDRDEGVGRLTLMATGQDGVSYAAAELSDGTLRFLALLVMSLDPDSPRLLCVEEPENGIHPDRIPALVRLIQRLVIDSASEQESAGPARQVIIATHSPGVVTEVPEDSLILAESVKHWRAGKHYSTVLFSFFRGTWREAAGSPFFIRPGSLLPYLNPSVPHGPDAIDNGGPRRVVDREEIRPLNIEFSEA